MLKLTNPTTLSPPGIFLLSSITEILEIAGVKDGIESDELSVKLLDICPGFYEKEETKNRKIYKRLKKANGLPFDINIEDALKKKMTPIVNVKGLDDGSTGVATHAMVAYLLTDYEQELIRIYI